MNQPRHCAEPDLLFPLSRFYESEHLALPSARTLSGAEMPEPYRRLLVHQRDMTSTLEEFYGERMLLRVLHSGRQDDAYCREILLVGADSGKVVEYGSIRIFIERFEPVPRAEILSETLPLGAILTKNAVPYTSAPRAFFRIDADAVTTKHFKLTEAAPLYGRRNKHAAPGGETLADIVEILAPVS